MDDRSTDHSGEPATPKQDGTDDIAVTIIIATYNRSSGLWSCLESVRVAAERALPRKSELLVVCNACPDDTPQVARAFAEAAGFAVRVLWEPRQGACRARNLGIAQARGHIMAITDDDCQLAPDYISKLIEAHEKDETPTLRGGRLELGDPSDMPMTVRTDLNASTFNPPNFPGGYLQGCNFTFTREVADKVGWFDTRFGPGTPVGAAEDTDYLFRAWKLGVPVVYDPSIVIYHHHGRKTVDEVTRLYRVYNQADGAFYAKHALHSPHILKNLYWDLRNAFLELVGGPLFNERLKLRHGPRVLHVLTGAVSFLRARKLDEAPSGLPRTEQPA